MRIQSDELSQTYVDWPYGERRPSGELDRPAGASSDEAAGGSRAQLFAALADVGVDPDALIEQAKTLVDEVNTPAPGTAVPDGLLDHVLCRAAGRAIGRCNSPLHLAGERGLTLVEPLALRLISDKSHHQHGSTPATTTCPGAVIAAGPRLRRPSVPLWPGARGSG
jgi:hypothetical protein